jgi:hypothetical protein
MRKKQPDPVIPFLGTRYAKDCIPLENKCNMTVVTDGGGGGQTLLGNSEGGKTSVVATQQARKKRQRFYTQTSASKARRCLEKNGVNRRKTLPVDAILPETQLRDLIAYCYFPWWSPKLNRSIRSPIAGRPGNVGVVWVGHRIVEIVAAAVG